MSKESDTKQQDKVANAIEASFISPNVSDSNFEAANIVDVINEVSRALFFIGKALGTNDAHTSMGGMELLAKEIKDASERVADAMHNIADAIRCKE